jgi:hypothetical protein
MTPARAMHQDLWSALRRVRDGELPGSPGLRDLLIERGLIEWVPGESGLRLTASGVRVIQKEGR